jgi:anti-anti-sigma factor
MNDALVVHLDNEFDAEAVTSLRTSFESFSEVNVDVLVDLEDVHFIDSSGIGALVFLYKRLAVNGNQLLVVGVRGQPKELFQMLHLDKTIQCYPTIKDYIRSSHDKPAAA